MQFVWICLCCSAQVYRSVSSEQFLLVSLLLFRLRKEKVLIETRACRGGVVHLSPSSMAAELARKGKSGPQGFRGQSSVLAGHDLPDDEVAALGFSQ